MLPARRASARRGSGLPRAGLHRRRRRQPGVRHRPTVRLGYTSLVTPASVYDYDLATGELTLLKQTAGARRLRPAPTTSSTASGRPPTDGTQVPISLVVPARTRRATAPRPCLLYGYGSYEISIDPCVLRSPGCPCSTAASSSPIAHVRGGGEMGRRWYDDGKLLHKTQHVHRLRRLRPAPGRAPAGPPATGWSAEGGSRRRPADGRGRQPGPGRVRRRSSPQVPFVDALTTILDPSLPLTVTEWEEWGNPLDDPEVYAYMKSYTPYENVGRRGLPADPGHDQPQRHPGALPRAGQVGRPAARDGATAGRSC